MPNWDEIFSLKIGYVQPDDDIATNEVTAESIEAAIVQLEAARRAYKARKSQLPFISVSDRAEIEATFKCGASILDDGDEVLLVLDGTELRKPIIAKGCHRLDRMELQLEGKGLKWCEPLTIFHHEGKQLEIAIWISFSSPFSLRAGIPRALQRVYEEFTQPCRQRTH